MVNKKSTSSLISDLKRKTRKAYSSEEKIRIIIEGMRGETTIAELCRKEGISQGNYYKWAKDFTLKVVDLRGIAIYSEQFTPGIGEFKKVINLERPISGIYYLQIANDHGISNRKIVIL